MLLLDHFQITVMYHTLTRVFLIPVACGGRDGVPAARCQWDDQVPAGRRAVAARRYVTEGG